MNDQISIASERCFIDGRLVPATIHMAGGKISQIETGCVSGATYFQNNVILPGVIDVHVHVNEPGRTEWEGFETATNAAAAGGVTLIVDMPLNASPVTTTKDNFEIKIKAAEGKMQVHVGLYGGLIPGNLHQLPDLLNTGILGIKCFLSPSGIEEFQNVSAGDLDAAMPLIAKSGIPLLAHCEIVEDAIFKPHDILSYKEYMLSRPPVWEHNAIKLLLAKSAEYDCPVHIVHVSSSESLTLIKEAKEQGIKVTAETCPHYLLFDAEHIPDGNPLFKCAPPIRSRQNNDELIEGLQSGILDFISSDHSPAPPDIKKLDTGHIAEAWGGIAGLQFLLSGSWSAVSTHIGLENFIPLLTSQPAKFLQVENRKGSLKPGYDADITIWNPEAIQAAGTITNFHRHAPSPYNSYDLKGKIIQTYVAGELVFNYNQIVHKNSGQWVLRK